MSRDNSTLKRVGAGVSVHHFWPHFIASMMAFIAMLLVFQSTILPDGLYISDLSLARMYVVVTMLTMMLFFSTLIHRKVVGDAVLGATTLFATCSFLTMICAILVNGGSPDQTSLLLLSLTTGVTAGISLMTFVSKELNSKS